MTAPSSQSPLPYLWPLICPCQFHGTSDYPCLLTVGPLVQPLEVHFWPYMFHISDLKVLQELSQHLTTSSLLPSLVFPFHLLLSPSFPTVPSLLYNRDPDLWLRSGMRNFQFDTLFKPTVCFLPSVLIWSFFLPILHSTAYASTAPILVCFYWPPEW